MSELDETPPLAPVDALRAEAAVLAAANPPSRVLATVVLGMFTLIGFVIGRTYLAAAAAVAFVGLAVKYGYRKGAKTPTEPKKRAPRS
jgi:hypothetical protein